MSDFLRFITIIVLACIFSMLFWISKHVAVIDYKTQWPQDVAWSDGEYQSNKMCSYLVGAELNKCREYFELN